MARRPDPPGLQAAKGNPGRRKPAKTRAGALASTPGATADALSPPEFMDGAEDFAGALAVWRELAPELKRNNLLERPDRYTFAMYCVHMADWIDLTKKIATEGTHYEAEGVTGQKLWRLNPAVKAREIAERHILEIGPRFGLNPADRYKLLKDQSAAKFGLFDRVPDGKDDGAKEGDGVDNPVGLLGRAAASPPVKH